jgi:8-oxo-dGTP pyrophosphatase MutT (NUDIX family)
VGAGVLPLSTVTGRVLLGRRSGHVEEPWTWGTWGGAVAGVPSRYASDPAARRSAAGVDLAEAALREFREESGWDGAAAEIVPLLVYRERGFRYHNFLLVLGDEFEPRLDWEHDDAAWWGLDELPEDLHFGLEALLADPASARAIAARRGGQ